MLWECFSSTETLGDGNKYWAILEDNLLEAALQLRLGWRFTFQHDNNAKQPYNQTYNGKI